MTTLRPDHWDEENFNPKVSKPAPEKPEPDTGEPTPAEGE